MTGSDIPSSFRLAYVPGVTPTKWVRVWHERLPHTPLELVQATAADAPGLLVDGGADAGLVRLPVDRDVLSAIPLYTETTVVVIPKDHVATAADEVAPAELADEIVLHPLDDVLGWEALPGRPAFERPETTADAIELVAAGVGVLLVPQSLARLHHRKDLTYRPVREAPESRVALSWPTAEETRTWWRSSSGSSGGAPSTAPGAAWPPRSSGPRTRPRRRPRASSGQVARAAPARSPRRAPGPASAPAARAASAESRAAGRPAQRHPAASSGIRRHPAASGGIRRHPAVSVGIRRFRTHGTR